MISINFFIIQIETFYEDQNITRRVKVNTTTEFNLTYMFPTSVEDNTSEWETVYLGTEQVRQLRYVDRMNVLGKYSLLNKRHLRYV